MMPGDPHEGMYRPDGVYDGGCACGWMGHDIEGHIDQVMAEADEGGGWHVCDVAHCEQGFATIAEVVAHEQTHKPTVADPVSYVAGYRDGQSIALATLPSVLKPVDADRLRQAGRKVAEWTAERDRLVKEAVAAGGSLREVGEAVGLTHTAVKFIAHGRPNR